VNALHDPLSLAFLDACRLDGSPPTTIKRRAATLRSVGNAGTATREDLERWWSTRAELSPSTRATDLANLATFYRWCSLWEHRVDNPLIRIKRPKVPQGLPAPVTEPQLEQLLRTYREADPEVFRAMVLGACAGLRVAEAAALRWADVDQAGGRLTVTGKGSKTRRISITAATLADLGPAHEPAASVVTGTTQPLTPEALGQKVNRAMRRVGVRATFHKLRHRYGTVAYRATQDLVAVGKLMGHSSLTTTAVYSAAADEIADRIAAAVGSPLPPTH